MAEVMMNKTFNEVYTTPDPDVYATDEAYFYAKWLASGFATSEFQNLTENSIKLLFHLLSGKYGDNQIINQSEAQFDKKLWSIVFQYGPFWQKELNIQKELQGLALTDGSAIYLGSKAIYNHSYNPSQTPATTSLDELKTIDDQNTTNYKKSKLEGLAALEEVLKRDVTETFLQRFKILFKKFLPYTRYERSE